MNSRPIHNAKIDPPSRPGDYLVWCGALWDGASYYPDSQNYNDRWQALGYKFGNQVKYWMEQPPKPSEQITVALSHNARAAISWLFSGHADEMAGPAARQYIRDQFGKDAEIELQTWSSSLLQ